MCHSTIAVDVKKTKQLFTTYSDRMAADNAEFINPSLTTEKYIFNVVSCFHMLSLSKTVEV